MVEIEMKNSSIRKYLNRFIQNRGLSILLVTICYFRSRGLKKNFRNSSNKEREEIAYMYCDVIELVRLNYYFYDST